MAVRELIATARSRGYALLEQQLDPACAHRGAIRSAHRKSSAGSA